MSDYGDKKYKVHRNRDKIILPLCLTRGDKEMKSNRDNINPQDKFLPDCFGYR